MLIHTKQIHGLQEYVQGTVGNSSNSVWGSFYSNSTQTNPSSTASNSITFDYTDPDSSGVSIVSNSRITVSQAGVYNIQFSAQIDKTDSNDDSIEIWLSKNGSNIPYTNTELYITGNNAKFVAAWNFVIKLNASDYVELKWYSADVNMRLIYQTSHTNPDRPSVPSVILTVTRAV
jgi:hypothetical protein